ncbi:PBP1A family penicillin-binding protein [Pelagibius litoralis]|uniref:PBP1A family penicillin-binding protein n=1 Tax=Pelagibius litoralis TaxID=374515 RepID=A0A967C615_9PROT|nr:PBP1A family penicillin-binding protein [Pelagibius litoralis]NIA68111.1 PBP1A family penicillin-binding protein [Pelagibius litoralis]
MAEGNRKGAGRPAGKAGSAKGRSRKTTVSSRSTRKNGTRGKRALRAAGILRRVATWSLVATIWVAVLGTGVLAWYAYDLPEVGEIEQLTRRPNITLLAADGSRLASFGDRFGATRALHELPPHLPRAVIAVEDRRFYDHGGIDFRGLLRAVFVNIRDLRLSQGGSTLTQQLAKNLFLTSERTFKRKIQEVMLAFWLERRFTKDQILTIYLNRVYLGAGTYGVDAAARHYFGKPATEATLYESALLAGLLKAPSRLNPTRDPAGADQRAGLVLQTMIESGFINRAAAEAALAEKTPTRVANDNMAPHFADWILAQARAYLGGIDSDIRIVTTIDPKLQRIARDELTGLLNEQAAARQAGQAALVSLSPDGAVRAMVGGRDYGVSQFNRATQALRQPGSAFKTFVYLAGLEAGLNPDSEVQDAPVRFGKWTPKNYGGRYYGKVTLRESFARSMNSVAVRITQKVGPKKVVEAARRLGITSELRPNGGISLGASEVTLLELTGAYAVFANQGRIAGPHGITEIRDARGKLLFRREASAGETVVSAGNIAKMSNMMSATVVWGTGKAAQPGRAAAGKTGTSQDFRDAWFIGYTAELVTGVWFGNDDGAPMDKVTGGNLPAQLWGRTMTRALDGQPQRSLPGGGDLIAQNADDSIGGFIGRILKGLTGDEPAAAPRPASQKRAPSQQDDKPFWKRESQRD